MDTDRIYGTRPIDLGLINLSPAEMMFWLYCPIKLPRQTAEVIPDNLKQFERIIDFVFADLSGELWRESYIYLTAKTLWCTPENPGNRPGWHSDGFLTDDLNYVWSDANPTVFYDDGELHSFTADHSKSLPEMDQLCEADEGFHERYPNKHLLKLDQRVLHKVDTNIEPGLRTFVKVSVSQHRYALQGNSVNHALPGWEYKPRGAERNCPIEGAA